MAKQKKHVVVAKNKTRQVGRPKSVSTDDDEPKKKRKEVPVTLFLTRALKARVKLACLALGTNINEVARDLFQEWTTSPATKKAIKSVVEGGELPDDDEDDDTDADDVDTDDTEADDDDAEESDEDEEEEDED